MSHFKDHFSKHSSTYARYRPQYPVELFEYLTTLVNNFDLAWDCGTGNGQSAVSLARYFNHVFATDPSEQQISHAVPHERVTYKVEKAEHCSLENNSVDLITIAQALHWFNFDEFYTEAKRVLKHNAVIAAWTYGVPSVSAAIDEPLLYFHDHIVGSYWQDENRMARAGYTTIPFPFDELPGRIFKMTKDMSLDEFIGHIQSWSATQRFVNANGTDPVPGLKQELLKLWSDPEIKKEVSWQVTLKAGRHLIK